MTIKLFIILLIVFCNFSLQAMSQEDRKIIKNLLDSGATGKKLNEKIESLSDPPLFVAIQNKKDTDLLQRLLENGADPNITDDTYYYTPLCKAIVTYRNIAGAQLLLQYRANPNMTWRHDPLLMWAATEDHNHAVVELLLRYNVHPDIESVLGAGSPLMECIWQLVDSLCSGKEDDLKKCIKILLDYGADPTKQATNGLFKGKNAINLAQENNLDDVLQLLQESRTRKDNKE